MASPSECLVNQAIMGGCNHPDCSIEEERYAGRSWEVAVCVNCGLREPIYGSLVGEKPDPLQVLKAKIPNHFADMTMLRRVLRELELQGWRWSVNKRDGVYHYSISKGQIQVDGAPSTIETEAVSDAITRLARRL